MVVSDIGSCIEQHYQLMAERNVLQNQGLTRFEAGEDGIEE